MYWRVSEEVHLENDVRLLGYKLLTLEPEPGQTDILDSRGLIPFYNSRNYTVANRGLESHP